MLKSNVYLSINYWDFNCEYIVSKINSKEIDNLIILHLPIQLFFFSVFHIFPDIGLVHSC